MNDDTGVVTAVGPEGFAFECAPGVSCFNACCRDLVQPLTPYDILMLSLYMGMAPTAFVKSYAVTSIGPGSGLPVVTLRPKPGPERECPFVTDSGCMVYPARPGSCRSFPLTRVVRRNRETGSVAVDFYLIRDPVCRGHGVGKHHTIDEWITIQEIEPYNRANDMLLDLVAAKNRFLPGCLEPGLFSRVADAMYSFAGDDFNALELSDTTMAMDLVKKAVAEAVDLIRSASCVSR